MPGGYTGIYRPVQPDVAFPGRAPWVEARSAGALARCTRCARILPTTAGSSSRLAASLVALQGGTVKSRGCRISSIP
ncbi:MAG TPA: hypothetical protein DIC36_05030 [Gammaproteobacteria bacterium]|nr:hypothetical protein [Gammaproteobacteria bacterium]